MSEAAQNPAPGTERFILRGVANGGAAAVADLFDRHAGRVFGILRMALPTAEAAEEALWETFAVAADRARSFGAQADAGGWLTTIALERIAVRSVPAPPTSLDDARRRRATALAPESAGPAPAKRSDSGALAGVTDHALATVVRTLELQARQALVMRHLCGLSDAEAAEVIGCEASEVEGLVGRAIAGIDERLGDHQDREAELRRQLADANPYRLRPIDGMGPIGGARTDFDTEVRGARVFATKPPQMSFLGVIRDAVRAVLDAFRNHDYSDPGDDDVGDVNSTSAPEPTATQRPLEKPKRTPSLTDYHSPKLSPGVAVYAMPRSTPTTERISSPRRPIPAPGWSSVQTRGRRR